MEDDLDEKEDAKDSDADANLSLRRHMHAEHSKMAMESISSSIDEYDKNLLKLSTVFLGLSLTFMKDIVHVDKITHVYSLYASWAFFSITIASVIASFQLSVQANERHLEVIYDYYLKKDDAALRRPNHWNTAVILVNLTSGSCFVLGVITSVYFVVANFGGK